MGIISNRINRTKQSEICANTLAICLFVCFELNKLQSDIVQMEFDFLEIPLRICWFSFHFFLNLYPKCPAFFPLLIAILI